MEKIKFIEADLKNSVPSDIAKVDGNEWFSVESAKGHWKFKTAGGLKRSAKALAEKDSSSYVVVFGKVGEWYEGSWGTV